MGIAAYNRGNRVISRGLGNHVLGESTGKPDPRPATWGEKARARAEDHARRIVAGADRYGIARPSVEILTVAVQEAARVGEETARSAAVLALS